MRFENKKMKNEKKKKKTHFTIRKNIFILLLFFGWSFGFALQR